MIESIFVKIRSALAKWNQSPSRQGNPEQRLNFSDYLDYRRLPSSSTNPLTKDQAPSSLIEALNSALDEIFAKLVLVSNNSNNITIVVYGPPRSGTSTFARFLAIGLREKIEGLGKNWAVKLVDEIVAQEPEDLLSFNNEHDVENARRIEVVVMRHPEEILRSFSSNNSPAGKNSLKVFVKAPAIWADLNSAKEYLLRFTKAGFNEEQREDLDYQIDKFVNLCGGHYYLILKISCALTYQSENFDLDSYSLANLLEFIERFKSEFQNAFSQIANMVPKEILEQYFNGRLIDRGTFYREYLDSLIPPIYRNNPDFERFLMSLYPEDV
ncbi:MAG: hypothetical protein KatS3mg096_891 [Candidatus Parcubacteria bacterium]|nr:MAG: hypothetical protein KatS3mg096_891 [Candidatus Parcubacteria bacterium]